MTRPQPSTASQYSFSAPYANRAGGKTAALRDANNMSVCFPLSEQPLRCPFEPSSFSGDESRVNLALELDAETIQWAQEYEQALVQAACKQLELEERNYVSFLKSNEKYGTTLLKTKWQKDGPKATRWWDEGRTLMAEAPISLATSNLRACISPTSVWMQPNKTWGFTIATTDATLCEGQSMEVDCPF